MHYSTKKPLCSNFRVVTTIVLNLQSFKIFMVYFQTAEVTASIQAEGRINCLDFYNVSYRNDPKFSDKQVCTNCIDPDQTAPGEEGTIKMSPQC